MPTDITIQIFARGGKDATLERRTRLITPELAAEIVPVVNEMGSEARTSLCTLASGRFEIRNSDDGINLPSVWVTITTPLTEKLRTVEPALLKALVEVVERLFHAQDPSLTIRVDLAFSSAQSDTIGPVRRQKTTQADDQG